MRARIPVPFFACFGALCAVGLTVLPPAPAQQSSSTAQQPAQTQQQPPAQQPTPNPAPNSAPSPAPNPTPDEPKLPPQQPVMPPAPGEAGSANASAQVPLAQNATGGSPFTLSASETGTDAPAVNEDELRQQLQGKTFYLRGGYLENSLHFNEHGALEGSSPQASYTLSLVQIDHVHLDKKHVELECVRYGLHFLGASPLEDQAVDKVRLTTKKKPLRITIAREEVVKAKEEKEKKKEKGPFTTPASTPPLHPPGAVQPPPEEQRRGGVVTISQGHANQALQTALDRVFSAGIDDKMISTLPEYWKIYFKSLSAKQNYRPADSSILRQTQVDQKARLVSAFEPPSNEYAQTNGVAGMAMYHVVVGPDGKAQQIAVGRPIGFGLDENAVDAIRHAAFQPAMKDGKPVPVMLELVVQFRIFSKRTAVATNQPLKAPGQQDTPVLPGPYTANAPKPPAQPQPDQPQPDQTQSAPPPAADQPAAQPPPSQPQPSQPPAPQPQ